MNNVLIHIPKNARVYIPSVGKTSMFLWPKESTVVGIKTLNTNIYSFVDKGISYHVFVEDVEKINA